jgi:hypothetical protein
MNLAPPVCPVFHLTLAAWKLTRSFTRVAPSCLLVPIGAGRLWRSVSPPPVWRFLPIARRVSFHVLPDSDTRHRRNTAGASRCKSGGRGRTGRGAHCIENRRRGRRE